MDPAEIEIRTIGPRDNEALARIIRSTLAEFGANHPGTVYFDEATDHLYEGFSATHRSVYFVAEHKGIILGGGGIFPSNGLPADTAELVKMYLLPGARGIGLGRKLIDRCLEFARAAGYSYVYLETMPELKNALRVYERSGFEYLDHSLGDTGHFGCGLWMLKKL